MSPTACGAGIVQGAGTDARSQLFHRLPVEHEVQPDGAPGGRGPRVQESLVGGSPLPGSSSSRPRRAGARRPAGGESVSRPEGSAARVHIFPSRCVTPRTFLPSLSRRRAERAQSAGGREQLAVRFASGRWNEGPTRVFSEERTNRKQVSVNTGQSSNARPRRKAGRRSGDAPLDAGNGPPCREGSLLPVIPSRSGPPASGRWRTDSAAACWLLRVVSCCVVGALLVLGACGELHGPAWLPVAATG